MPRKTRSKNPDLITRAECHRTTTTIKEELRTIRTALVGEDYRGGIVKDVSDLKKDRSITAQLVKSVVVPIVVALATAWVITGMPH